MYTTVKELLSDPTRWIQGRSFATAEGDYADGMNAVRFCLRGAIDKVYLTQRRRDDAIARVAAVLRHRHDYSTLIPFDEAIVSFNDMPWRKHAEIMAVLEEAGV